MNNSNFKNVWRFIILVLLQVTVFKQIIPQWSYGNYFQVFIYPIFILLLPFRYSKILIIFLAFVLGLSIDVFYDSIGIHASACLFTAFIRPTVLSFLKPQSDYDSLTSPNMRSYGLIWFLSYSSILMFLHLFFYFSVEAFTFVYLGQIILKTFAAFISSLLFILLYQFIFNPK